ncbi:MAG: amidohydrolase family protein, partial [Gemmatimonadota bacterium]|nr:amidohydrolase family protein [Gemmatimonadota bacterium]
PADWTDVASYFELIEASGISVNHAMLVGHGGLRRNKIGLVDRHLSADEMKAVIRALEEGMDQGAVGLSTGLEYIPGLYTPIEEVIALARVVASREGLYASHIRCESALLLESVNEAIETGSQSGVRVQISHFKAAGRPNWHKQADSLGLIEKAREAGVDIMADAYPYTAYSTGLTYYLEPWAKEGGAEAMVARLHDPGQRARIRRELNLAIANSPGTFDLIVIASVKTEQNKPVIGKNLVEIGDIWDLEPLDVLMRLLEEESDRVSFVGHGMNPENVEMVLAHPQVMIGSDGYSIAPWGKAAESQPHPRSYGTYPRVLGYYARQRRIFDLPTAVKKMTSMPADRMRFTDRGRIGPGMKADLVLFNADTVIDIATFENPHQFPKGIEQVLVNGVTVVENSRHTGARPGRVLRKA